MNKLLTFLDRSVLVSLALLVLTVIPITVLINRHPFRNYALKVGVQWLRTSIALLRALGCTVSGGVEVQGVSHSTL